MNIVSIGSEFCVPNWLLFFSFFTRKYDIRRGERNKEAMSQLCGLFFRVPSCSDHGMMRIKEMYVECLKEIIYLLSMDDPNPQTT